MTKQDMIRQARTVNRIVIDHLRNGRVHEARHCRGFRNQWMAEARRA